MNKETELFYLLKFKENFPSFPHGDVCPDERPDFLIKTATKIVGLEVTHLYREMTSSGMHPPLQQRESVRQKIMSLAKSIYDSKGLPSVFVSVHFDLNFYCCKSEMQRVAERLVNLAEQSLSGLPQEKIWRVYEIEIGGVMMVSVRSWKAEKSHWNHPLASFVPTVNPQQIQSILDGKNARCADYRKKCDEIWLIIIIDRLKPSSFSMVPDAVTEHRYTHGFDSAFLFFHDYPHEQKPPFLLKIAG